MNVTGTNTQRRFHVEHVATSLTASQRGVICDHDPSCQFYGMEPIIDLAGFPHPERSMCPWHNKDVSVPIPHVVQDGAFETYFKPPGAWIDLYTQYPAPYGGQGPDQPSDMFWPQKEVVLYAYVTYNFWPEQNKDVAFEVKDPHGTTWGIYYARTGEDGIAWVKVRLPWPCDDPEYYLGEWHVTATVDVASKIIDDTLTFKYDYLVHIWKVTTDKDSYAHCEYINVTIDYGSYAMQDYPIILTITAVDETGVPFGFTFTEVTIGGAQYCTYKNNTITLSIHVPKFARAGLAKIFVGALNGWPQEGGGALCPQYVVEVGILAE